MSYVKDFYPESRFGGFTRADGTVAFYQRVNALIRPESVVLEVGSGRGRYDEDPVLFRRNLRIFRGRCRKVVGIDVDPGARANPFLDEFKLIESPRWPISDESVDVSICDSVLEHVEDPDAFFSEFRRTIKPGGYLCIRTPNAMSYFGFMSRLIPNKWHAKVLARAQETSDEQDIFPTVYRCNTKWKLQRILANQGLDHCVFGYESEPAYLSFSRVAYALGVLHQKLAPDFLKLVLFAFAQKKAR